MPPNEPESSRSRPRHTPPTRGHEGEAGAVRMRSLRALVTAAAAARSDGLLLPATAPKWRGALKKSFQANGGLLYKENFLSPATYEAVRKECRSLRKHFKRELDSIATGRLGCCVDSRSEAYRSLMTEDVSTALSCVTGQEALYPSEYPVELRLYTTGAAMDWHQDDTLYKEPQTEVVFTLDNTSDSRTEWMDPSGERHSTWTEPNSAIIVRAGQLGPPHRVTPLRRGERWILKLVYTSTSERSANYDDHIDSFPRRRVKKGSPRR